MAQKPENKVRDHLRRELIKFSEATGLSVAWEANPASRFSTPGKEDVTVVISSCYYLHIELKAAGKVLRDSQKLRQKYLISHNRYYGVVAGSDGVHAFMLGLPTILQNISTNIIKGIKEVREAMHDRYSTYRDIAVKRQTASLQRPTKQVSRIQQKFRKKR